MKLKASLLGFTQGGAGNVVVSNWKGQTYLRQKSTKFTTSQSPAQIAHRAKFKLMMQTLKRAKPIIELGYRELTERQTPMNVAMSMNMRTAIKGEYPALSVDYQQLKLSLGPLVDLSNVMMTSTESHVLQIEWSAGNETIERFLADKVLLHIYSPEMDRAWNELNIAERGDEILQLDLPDYYSGKTVHVFVTMLNEPTGLTSPSKYLGEILIA